ncbi:MAG: hypothetical protein ALAOOOJD_00125 [bacterium]|nr:hypothetical protein [bacterium]
MKRQSLEFGPVVVEGWFDEPRIGYYDDDVSDDDKPCAIVNLGGMFLDLSVGCHTIPHDFLRAVTTEDLWNRREAIHAHIDRLQRKVSKKDRPPYEERYHLLLELVYVSAVLMDRLFIARFHVRGQRRARVFISHSSKDKQFANWLYVDLANAGHRPWLDEPDIRAGESIPTKIASGIHDCDYVVVVLSANAVKSQWVEREWQAKYWNEVKGGKVMVIPVLIEDCEIPTLLQTKKYADFRSGYNEGFETLLAALLPAKTRQLAIRSTRTRVKVVGTGKRKR